MSNLINEINAENILIDVQELNRLELIDELEMGIYEASYWSFDDLVNLVVELIILETGSVNSPNKVRSS